MPASWIISVQGHSYGPYTDAQMETFAQEGRLVPHSLVARAGETNFRAACEEPSLTALFAPAGPAASLDPAPAYSEFAPSSFGRQDDSTKVGERSHIVIVADMKSRSIDGLEEEIFKLGPAVAFLPQVWLLSSDQSVNAIRNVLVQQLGKLDMLFVIDATHDKAAWFNFGPEIDARIRRNWARAPELSAKRSALG